MDTAWVAAEMQAAKLKDARRRRSLVRITAAVAAQPDSSLTTACGDALRQAAHRLFEHPDTSVSGLLAGHYAQTARRCAEVPVVLIAQDTTFFTYQQAQIEGLGRLNQQGKSGGLVGHSALALTEAGTPLGLLSLQLWGAADGSAPYPHAKESAKWTVALNEVTEHLPATVRAIVIQDREADCYDFLAAPRRPGVDLLVRACRNRAVTIPRPSAAPVEETTPPTSETAPAGELPSGEQVEAAPTTPEPLSLLQAAATAPVLGEWQVLVPCAAQSQHQILSRQRQATLEIRATAVQLPRPPRAGAAAETVEIWVVAATELAPPAGEEPVTWTLLTTLAIPDLPTACRIVGYYARRWLIERLHFTLKSGLRAERLQIDDVRSLSYCLAVYYIVAWRLLHLPYVARDQPERNPSEVLEPAELIVLRAPTAYPLTT